MKKTTQITTVLAALLMLAASPAPAEAGFELMGGGGMNMCQESGDADCDDIDPSFGFFVAPGLRLNQSIGLFFDMGYGFLSPDTKGEDVDVTMTTLYLMPTFRFFTEIMRGSGEFYGGIGAGYMKIATEAKAGGESLTMTWTNMLNFKFTAGLLFWVSPTLGVGGAFDYLLSMNGSGEFCAKSGGQEECIDGDDLDNADIADLIQINAFVKFRF